MQYNACTGHKAVFRYKFYNFTYTVYQNITATFKIIISKNQNL